MPVCMPLVVLPSLHGFGEIIHVQPVRVSAPACPMVLQTEDPVPGEAQLLRLLPVNAIPRPAGPTKEGP
jgi:hypothetical protein